MSKTELYELKDKDSNISILWNTQLKPRLRSGLIGYITINPQFTIKEASLIMAKLGFKATGKSGFESGVLKACGYERLPKKAENTINPVVADKTKALSENAEAFIKALNEKFPLNSEVKQPNVEQLKSYINNNFKDSEKDRNSLYKHYNISEEKPTFSFWIA